MDKKMPERPGQVMLLPHFIEPCSATFGYRQKYFGWNHSTYLASYLVLHPADWSLQTLVETSIVPLE